MKKTIITTLLALLTVASYSAKPEPLKFLGIPVDGTETHFGYKLKEKGFTYNSYLDIYKGQFNGSSVDIAIHTHHNNVDRVVVFFPKTTERSIRSQYNRLLSQFQSLDKYVELSPNEAIPEDEDISYEITVKEKNYEASFCYFDPNRNKEELLEAVVDKFSDLFTEEQLAEVKKGIKQSSQSTQESGESQIQHALSQLRELGMSEEEADVVFKFLIVTLLYEMSDLADGSVWFRISEDNGDYRIVLYYDNLHNQAHGEDL